MTDLPVHGVRASGSRAVPALAAFVDRLFRPEDAVGAALFRVGFGVVIAWEATRYLRFGWIEDYWTGPAFHFTYPGFGWVAPLPHDWMVGLLCGLCGFGVFVALGIASRPAVALIGLGWTYLFLLDQVTYLNHMFLICMLAGVLAVAPVHGSLALGPALSGQRVDRVPAWGPWLLRGLLALVYFYGGVAKLNPDWLRAQPMLTWMEHRRDMAHIGPLLAADATAWLLSYGGLLLDLAVGPLLLWRRGRPLAIAALFFFHLANSVIFEIGVFPWLMLASTVVFLEPATLRRILGAFAPALATPRGQAPPTPALCRAAVLAFLGSFALVQLALPLRHWLYPGDVSWTEEGHRFSWHMKLRSKWGHLEYRVVDRASGDEEIVEHDLALSDRQLEKMQGHPDMIWLYAQHLAAEARAEGRDVAVFAEARASLNGRPPRPLIDPTVDLSRVPRHVWTSAPWILPLDEPLAD